MHFDSLKLERCNNAICIKFEVELEFEFKFEVELEFEPTFENCGMMFELCGMMFQRFLNYYKP